MTPPGFATNDVTTFVAAAFPDVVILAVSKIAPNLAGGRWLSDPHYYVPDVVGSFENRHQPPIAGSDDEFAEYVAASAVVHVFDAWRYLGRSLEAYIRGDAATGFHLAYYAELRAAASVLAVNGVGLLNTRHGAIQKDGSVALFRGTTHQVAWKALNAWAAQPDATRLVGDLIRFDGHTLTEWLDAAGFSSTIPGAPAVAQRQLVSEWLKAWGLDLASVTKDRDRRNEVSYRPNSLSLIAPSIPGAIVEDVERLWRAFEPSGTAFASIDRHLVRIAIEQASAQMPGVSSQSQWAAKIEAAVDRALGILFAGDTDLKTLTKDFLTRKAEPANLAIIDLARDLPSGDVIKDWQGVSARAALLLRIATGLTAHLMQEASLPTPASRPWLALRAADEGWWEKGSEPASTLDLWLDIDDALGTLSTTTGIPEKKPWFDDAAVSIGVLVKTPIIALWGLGL